MYSVNNEEIETSVFIKLRKVIGDSLFNNDFVTDSRLVSEGCIFCAYPGLKNDGRAFIYEAIEKGAKFIILEDDPTFSCKIPYFKVKNLRSYLGLLIAEKYSYPTLNLSVIGVTGTNGKTSITHWLSQVYHLQNILVGIVGTTGVGIYPDMVNYNITTPSPMILQQLFAKFIKEKIRVVSMEVSSHSLDQDRVNGIFFQTAIFTNLTQDHLDYHRDMEHYYLAKKKLFLWNNLKQIIINTDDFFGTRLYDELVYKNKTTLISCPRIISYGINSGDVRAESIKISLTEVNFQLIYNDERVFCKVGVIGKFNVYNLLAVACKLILDGYTLAQISKLMSKLVPVKGRMETLVYKDKPLVVVDYSHTPDSLYNALSTLKNIESVGKLYCVFGCGGNRDTSKRAIMGDIASSLSDYVILTSDNPRYENPDSIIAQIKDGIKSNNYHVIENRKDAIKYALETAQVNDIVLIAGKGHEDYQEINGVKSYFSDIEFAKEFLH